MIQLRTRNMALLFTIAVICIAALLGGGCTTGRQMYAGPALPEAQVARIGPSFFVSFVEVDGRRLSSSWRNPPVEIEVMPGTHRVFVDFEHTELNGNGYSMITRSSRPVEISLTVEAGHSYSVVWLHPTDKPHIYRLPELLPSAPPLRLDGTIWACDLFGRTDYIYVFKPGGVLISEPEGTAGKWKQDGKTVYMEWGDGYTVEKGEISGDEMRGTWSRKTGRHGRWVARLQSQEIPVSQRSTITIDFGSGR